VRMVWANGCELASAAGSSSNVLRRVWTHKPSHRGTNTKQPQHRTIRNRRPHSRTQHVVLLPADGVRLALNLPAQARPERKPPPHCPIAEATSTTKPQTPTTMPRLALASSFPPSLPSLPALPSSQNLHYLIRIVTCGTYFRMRQNGGESREKCAFVI